MRLTLAVTAIASICAVSCRRQPHPTRWPARVHRAEAAADLVPGPYQAGRPGDFVLENRFVRAVIDDVRQGGGFAMSGGQLVDLAPVGGIDELGQVFNFLGRFPRQLRYEYLRTETTPGGIARVIVAGRDPRTAGLEGETVYSLGPDDRAITLATTLRNRGTEPTEVGLGDAIQWSGAEHWIPGIGFSAPRQSDEPYIAGVGRHTAYAYIGEHALSGPNGSNWSNPTQGTVTIAPGADVRYVRRIGVAAIADVSRALGATGQFHPGALVVVHVRDDRGQPAMGVRITLREPLHNAAIALAETDDHGDARIDVAPGAYAVDVQAPGRVPDAATRAALSSSINVARNQTIAVAASVGPASTLAVTLHENGRPVPGRLLVYGVDATTSPFFGGIGRGDGARNSIVLGADGHAEFPLTPGRYRIIATHGPFFDLPESIVTLAPGAHEAVTLDVRRVVALDEDVCGDFHMHQAPSLDAPVSLRDRVRAAAAEGLDVIAATDHNVATDLGPALRDEHLDDRVLGLVGDELSTDAALHPMGHWNLYPLPYRTDAPLGGAPDLYDLSPRELVRRVRQLAPGAIIQVNHPRSGVPTGMFDVIGFDRNAPLTANSVMEPSIDAIEVWNGRNTQAADTVLLDWLALLRTGARITATANSDSHGIVVQEVGYPRTCIHAPGHAQRALTASDVVAALRTEHDAVLTDGPMIHVSADGLARAIGHAVPGTTSPVALTVRVESARWNAAEQLELVHSDGSSEPVPIVFTEDAGHVHGEAVVRVNRTEPFVLFRARGSQPISVLTDTPPLLPLAITNPIYLQP